MNVLDLQQQLDATGYLKLPAGVFTPAVPLFVPSDAVVVGDDSQRSLVDCDQSGYAFVHGMHRGTVPDECFTPDGFRTLGRFFLWGRGLAWDRGPTGGWPVATTLAVDFRGLTHQPTGWRDSMLCGMSGGGGDGSVSNPHPWCLYFEGDRVVFAARLGGEIFRFRSDPVATVAELSLSVAADFATGSLSLLVDGVAVPIQQMPAGRSMANNSVVPFCVGALHSTFSGVGSWGAWSMDVTVREVSVEVNGSLLGRYLGGGASRLPTYQGGPGLPLVRTWAGGKGCAHLFALELVMDGLPVDAGGRVERVRVKGSNVIPDIVLGRTFGFAADRLDLLGGSVGIQGAGGNVSYPVELTRCRFDGQKDCGLWLSRSIFKARDLFFRYPVRANAEFHNCSGLIDGAFVAPPGVAQDYGFLQRGGAMKFRDVDANYEWRADNGYALIHTQGDSDESPYRPTTLVVDNCTSGDNPVVAVLPPAPGHSLRTQLRVTGTSAESQWVEYR